MKTIKNHIWMIAIAIVATILGACTNVDEASEQKGKIVTLTTTLCQQDVTTTRTLTETGSGNATKIKTDWAIGDKFLINYDLASDASGTKNGTSVAEVTALNINNGTATVQATLNDAKDGGEIDFEYPYAHTSVGKDPYTEQIGTLSDINENYSIMRGSGTMSLSGTTATILDGGVAMIQDASIWKFTFTDGTNDITSSITNLFLSFNDGAITYSVKPTSQNAIYVAIYQSLPYDLTKVDINTTSSTKGYFKSQAANFQLKKGELYISENVALSELYLSEFSIGSNPLMGPGAINVGGSDSFFSFSCGYGMGSAQISSNYDPMIINILNGRTIHLVKLGYSDGSYKNTLSSTQGFFDGDATFWCINTNTGSLTISSNHSTGVKVNNLSIYYTNP